MFVGMIGGMYTYTEVSSDYEHGYVESQSDTCAECEIAQEG